MQWMEGMSCVAAVLVFLLLLLLSVRCPPQTVLRAYTELTGFVRERGKSSGWYGRTEAWLVKNGAAFHYGKWINPTSYLALCIVLSLAGFLALSGISVGYGVLAGLLLPWVPGWMLTHLNRRDNIRLLPEIKLVYHALELQIRAGVYVTDALAECYGSVQERRLHQALLDLTGDIVMKSDLSEAMARFQRKFDNRYIDTLCITILQALESGQAVELLGDIAEQIRDMEAVVMMRKKTSLDRSITFYQLGVLAAVMGVTLYACITHMYATAVRF